MKEDAKTIDRVPFNLMIMQAYLSNTVNCVETSSFASPVIEAMEDVLQIALEVAKARRT